MVEVVPQKLDNMLNSEQPKEGGGYGKNGAVWLIFMTHVFDGRLERKNT
jgi:hypothetical protein